MLDSLWSCSGVRKEIYYSRQSESSTTQAHGKGIVLLCFLSLSAQKLWFDCHVNVISSMVWAAIATRTRELVMPQMQIMRAIGDAMMDTERLKKMKKMRRRVRRGRRMIRREGWLEEGE